jgi:hypothetical protein
MPTGPKGQKRPADVIGNAVRVMRIATGEEADDVIDDGTDPAAKACLMTFRRFEARMGCRLRASPPRRRREGTDREKTGRQERAA